MAAHDLRRAINLLGSQEKPFLFAIDFAVREGWVWQEPLAQQEVLFRVGAYTNAPLTAELPPLPHLPLLVAHPLSEECYQGKFARIQEALSRGDSFLANLTISTPIETPLSLSEIFSRAEAPYKLMVPGRFVSFSPERFIRTQGGCKTIETNPMKGTIDAATPNAREHILQDYKETAEHYTIVDLMRNDLARVATNVRVEDRSGKDAPRRTTTGKLADCGRPAPGCLRAFRRHSIHTIARRLYIGSPQRGYPTSHCRSRGRATRFLYRSIWLFRWQGS